METLMCRYAGLGYRALPTPPTPPTTLINLTPHEVKIYEGDKTTVMKSYPSVGTVRLKENEPKMLDAFDGVPVHAPYEYSEPEFAFNETFKTIYPEEFKQYEKSKLKAGFIVSSLVAPELAKAGYTHVFAPDTGSAGAVRHNGEIVGTTQFTRFDV